MPAGIPSGPQVLQPDRNKTINWPVIDPLSGKRPTPLNPVIQLEVKNNLWRSLRDIDKPNKDMKIGDIDKSFLHLKTQRYRQAKMKIGDIDKSIFSLEISEISTSQNSYRNLRDIDKMTNPLYVQILKNGPFTPMERVEESTNGDMVIPAYYDPKDPSQYSEPE
ncbi:hypothetical protein AgCh_025113 [Apium graveolens]